MSEQIANIKFVKEVGKYECLYNYQLSEYSRKDITEKAWAEVGKEFCMTSRECKDKWKNLRSVFIRHLKPPPSGSGAKRAYYLNEAMQFAIPFIKMKKGETVGNITTKINCEAIDESIEVTPDLTSEEQDTYLDIGSPFKPPKRANKRQIQSEDVDKTFIAYLETKKSKYERTEKPENESNKLFLLSLQPELNEMSKIQLRTFKIEVMKLIGRITVADINYVEDCYNVEYLDLN